MPVKESVKPKSEFKVTKSAGNIFDGCFANVNCHDEIAVYFSGNVAQLYQVKQWLAVLKELEKFKKVTFITRFADVFDVLRQNTDFSVCYCRTIDDVLSVYQNGHFKCILYVNHGNKNFQSLIVNDALHIHINHGESDKLSTITNQSKAYDYVFVVGPLAYERYENNLINKDMSKFIQIGRPQLDHIEKIEQFVTNLPEPSSRNKEKSVPRKVVLYAPTWEGTHETMNYSSLGDFGVDLVNMILEQPDLYLIYKPHPTTGSRLKDIDKINQRILDKLKNSHKATVATCEDINSLYEHIDLAIFDNSAVAVDYLIVDKPMLMTDTFEHLDGVRIDKPKIVEATRLIKTTDMPNLIKIIKEELRADTVKQQRNEIKKYFLGDFDYANKQSTKMFIETICQLCDLRDREIENNKKRVDENLI
ncbi:hypothetical protein A6A21_02470 [Phocoenobacter uteri]|nr:hypothetical protein [Phocoenobacter uteri]